MKVGVTLLILDILAQGSQVSFTQLIKHVQALFIKEREL